MRNGVYRFMFSLLMASVLSCAGMNNPTRAVPAADDPGQLLPMADGTEIYKYVRSPAGEPDATVYVIAGITGINHIAENDVLEALGGEHHRVVVFHPRGTGYSGGKRGDVDPFELFISDLIELVDKDSETNRKILFGHSMSAAWVLRAATSLQKIDGIILVNPPVVSKASEGMSPSFLEYIKYGFYYVFAQHTPIVNMGGDPQKIENADEEAELRQNDPFLVPFFSLSLMSDARDLMDEMPANAKKIKIPLLLIYGTSDGLIEESGCELLLENWASSVKTYVRVPQGPHGKQTVLLATPSIQKWLAEKIVD